MNEIELLELSMDLQIVESELAEADFQLKEVIKKIAEKWAESSKEAKSEMG